jgi:predicted ATP-dependent serine protease
MNIKLANTPFVKIKDVTIPDIYFRRMKCGVEKIDAMFGDGILPGASVTVTARAGLGKTTLVLQMLEGLNKNGYRVGYCSSEESVAQLAMTCKRLNVHDVSVCNESDVDTISKHMDNLDVIVIDSFQGLAKGDLKGRELEKYCIEKLVVRAKETECAVILICHNTKTGIIKGSSLIIHAVDVNISIAGIKDAEANARVIRFDKNRFGPAVDIECFIEYSGYDFDTEVEHTDGDNADKPTKADRKSEQRRKLIDLLKQNKVNIADVCKALAVDATRAGFLLRELTAEGLVVKRGRGAEAKYKIVEQV